MGNNYTVHKYADYSVYENACENFEINVPFSNLNLYCTVSGWGITYTPTESTGTLDAQTRGDDVTPKGYYPTKLRVGQISFIPKKYCGHLVESNFTDPEC